MLLKAFFCPLLLLLNISIKVNLLVVTFYGFCSWKAAGIRFDAALLAFFEVHRAMSIPVTEDMSMWDCQEKSLLTDREIWVRSVEVPPVKKHSDSLTLWALINAPVRRISIEKKKKDTLAYQTQFSLANTSSTPHCAFHKAQTEVLRSLVLSTLRMFSLVLNTNSVK